MLRMGKVCKYAACLVLVLFLFNIMPVLPFNGHRQDVSYEVKKFHNIKANVPHEHIAIDGDTNFSATALAEGWSGDGSAQDPYIIENYDISYSPFPEICIKIVNTRLKLKYL